ncbi:hypothetical protein J6TS1_45390 [Siminovitchia terrae]|uniref:Uncharacterized protein n=1 Tax=Siminovitchia terrae TaxID=1914933 RepID=A0ABQ4L3Z7_SIMTE|nr:hypothetical protein J6TS1_45390 [Siminovitchia terrae]
MKVVFAFIDVSEATSSPCRPELDIEKWKHPFSDVRTGLTLTKIKEKEGRRVPAYRRQA